MFVERGEFPLKLLLSLCWKFYIIFNKQHDKVVLYIRSKMEFKYKLELSLISFRKLANSIAIIYYSDVLCKNETNFLKSFKVKLKVLFIFPILRQRVETKRLILL